MSSGSKGTPGVWKARTGKKGVETMMTELDQLKEFTICSIDEFRDEEVRMADTSFYLSEKASSPVSERSPAITGTAYCTLDKTKA